MTLAGWSFSVLRNAGPAMIALLCLAAGPIRAGSKQSTGNGNWNAPGTWTPAGVPCITDSVTILPGHTVTATSACSAGVLVIKGRDEATGAGGRFSNGTWPWRVHLRTSGGRSGNLIVESGSVADGAFDQSSGGWTTIEGDYINDGTHTAGSVELIVSGITVNNGTITRSGNATRDWVLRGGFTNSGSYTSLTARDPCSVGTAAAGGAFINTGTFDNRDRSRLYFFGDFVNDRPDANFGNTYVYFKGNTDSRIRGAGGARFWKAIIDKDSLNRTVTLDTTLVLTESSWGALLIERGTLATNGESLSVWTQSLGSAMTLGGGPEGRLLVNKGPGGRQSRAYVITLDQWDAPLGSVIVEDGLLHVREYHQIRCGVARFELRGGTVYYDRHVNDPNSKGIFFRSQTGPAEGGWFATGGTAVFNSAGIFADRYARFVASGSSVVRFEGNRNAGVIMARTGDDAHSEWEFNELVIAKTGGSTFIFNSINTSTSDVRVNRPFTLGAEQHLTLDGNFAPGYGYRFGDFAIESGALLAQGASELFVEGDWRNAGAFSPGNGRVSFTGEGVTGVLAPGGIPFHRVAVNRPDGGAELVTGLTVANELAVRAGRLALGANSLTLGTTWAGGTVTVEAGGALSAVGSSPGERSRVTAASAEHGYRFELRPDGAIAARYATFERMDSSGIVVAAGAEIDPTNNFSYCRFDRGAGPGPALKIENDQVLTLQEAFFYGSGGHNIEKLADAGRITVAGGGGERWGEDYEHDPHDRIDWTTVAVREDPDPVRPLMPDGFRVTGVAPNPLTGAGELRLALPAAERVSVRVYDATGRMVVRVADGMLPAGYHRLRLDAARLAEGVYLLRVEAGGRTETQKLVVSR